MLLGTTKQRFTIRFHFHPDVQVSLTGNGQTALLRLGDGTGWRFRSDTDAITLDDSVYLRFRRHSAAQQCAGDFR